MDAALGFFRATPSPGAAFRRRCTGPAANRRESLRHQRMRRETVQASVFGDVIGGPRHQRVHFELRAIVLDRSKPGTETTLETLPAGAPSFEPLKRTRERTYLSQRAAC